MKQGLKPLARLALLTSLLVAAACGFEPVFAPTDQPQQTNLSQIYVEQLDHSRTGQLLRNRLLEVIGAAPQAGAATHTLRFKLSELVESKVLQADGTTSRFNFTVTADFVLSRRSDGTIVRKGRVSRTTGYNVVGDDFATKIGAQDARRRLAEDLALGLRDRLIIAELN